jgi:hypothetical protein
LHCQLAGVQISAWLFTSDRCTGQRLQKGSPDLSTKENLLPRRADHWKKPGLLRFARNDDVAGCASGGQSEACPPMLPAVDVNMVGIGFELCPPYASMAADPGQLGKYSRRYQGNRLKLTSAL